LERTNSSLFLQRINFTFVGDLTTAQQSSAAVESLSVDVAASLGILAMIATAPPHGPRENTPLALAVALMANTTADDFAANIALQFHISTDVFHIFNSVKSIANLEIVGANALALAEALVALPKDALASLGATRLSLETTSVPTSGPSDASNSTIGGFVVLGGITAGVLLILVVYWNRERLGICQSYTDNRNFFARRRLGRRNCEVVAVMGVVLEDAPAVVVVGSVSNVNTPV
jgi:hypothetical protein